MFISAGHPTVLVLLLRRTGGIFALMLALGTLLGTAFGMAAAGWLSGLIWMRDAGGGGNGGAAGLLPRAATDRTGAGNDRQLPAHLPMIITCLGATPLAHRVENRYTPPFLPVPLGETGS